MSSVTTHGTPQLADTAFKQRNMGVFKTASANVMMKTNGTFRFTGRPAGPANATAYAVRFSPDVQFVSLDV